jgi:hypothetical protein
VRIVLNCRRPVFALRDLLAVWDQPGMRGQCAGFSNA